MKFRLLVKLVEKIMGTADDGPRGDMYLPDKVLALGLVLCGGGIGLAVVGLIRFSWGMILGGLAACAVGGLALLCWRNQKIVVLSDEQFAYTTFLGNTYVYNFADISRLQQNQDSMTLYVGDKKVHIESSAVLSGRLTQLISARLQKRG